MGIDQWCFFAITQCVCILICENLRNLWMGLIKRKERWSLTAAGWIVLIVVVAAVFVAAVLTVHPFLAVNDPVRGDILVVEGWLPDYAIERVIEIFKSGGYSRLVTTGSPLTYGSYLVAYKTCPEVAAGTLKKLGFDENLISVVPAPNVERDNTYAAGLSLRKWLSDSGMGVKSVDICSMGPHSRRTRFLFEKALGDHFKVGVIALESQEYDPEAWWKTSKGVRAVIDETVAYFYARFFFWPESP